MLVLGGVIWRLQGPQVDPIFKVNIYPDHNKVTHLDARRSPLGNAVVFIDTVDFVHDNPGEEDPGEEDPGEEDPREKNPGDEEDPGERHIRAPMLRHRKVGKLFLRHDFFLDLHGKFQVIKPGKYLFKIISDEGFSLKIDNKEVLRFAEQRKFSSSEVEIDLSAGEHELAISYFQVRGPLGLRGTYKYLGDSSLSSNSDDKNNGSGEGNPGSEELLLGESSKALKFLVHSFLIHSDAGR